MRLCHHSVVLWKVLSKLILATGFSCSGPVLKQRENTYSFKGNGTESAVHKAAESVHIFYLTFAFSFRRRMNPQIDPVHRVDNCLSIWVLEAKGVPAKRQFVCEVSPFCAFLYSNVRKFKLSLDGQMMARTSTKVMEKQNKLKIRIHSQQSAPVDQRQPPRSSQFYSGDDYVLSSALAQLQQQHGPSQHHQQQNTMMTTAIHHLPGQKRHFNSSRSISNQSDDNNEIVSGFFGGQSDAAGSDGEFHPAARVPPTEKQPPMRLTSEEFGHCQKSADDATELDHYV
ncbi:hypothetical protein niasHS_012308 [Heterodera schachtii]|uniref:Uncharacterized protein n=1 Tax=Heterodera schachtii TaxID=97005 RepID=A0ABD2IGQ6_HETSC